MRMILPSFEGLRPRSASADALFNGANDGGVPRLNGDHAQARGRGVERPD